MTDFFGGLVDPLLARWGRNAIGIAALFWAAVAAIVAVSRPELLTCPASGGAIWCTVIGVDPIGPWVAAGVALAVFVGTAVAASTAAPVALAVAQGDWAGADKLLILGAVLHRRRRTRLARKLKAVGQEIIELTNAKVATGADRETARTTVQATHRLAERARWEAATARYPTNEVPVRPTASGNLLAALRQRADQHLGLDLVVVWGPLLDVLPQQQRTRLTERSTAVLRLFEPVIPTLVLAFAASLIPSWPPAVAWIGGCVVLSATLYIRAVRGVRRYVDDVENTLVIHRAPLFRACGLLPPVDTAGEVRAGQQLSQYFWWVRRGTPRPELDFTWMSSKTDASSDTHADVAS